MTWKVPSFTKEAVLNILNAAFGGWSTYESGRSKRRSTVFGSMGGRPKEGALYYCLCSHPRHGALCSEGGRPREGALYCCFYAMARHVLRVATQSKLHSTVVCVLFLRHVTHVLRVATQRKLHSTVVCVLFLRHGVLCFEGGCPEEGGLYCCLCLVFTPWRPVFRGWLPKGRWTLPLFVFVITP